MIVSFSDPAVLRCPKHAMVRVLPYFLLVLIAIILILTVTLSVRPASNSSPYSVSIVDSDRGASGNEWASSSYHYGVVIDAGSSGSRVFVYVWPSETSGKSNELIKIKSLIDEETGRAVVKKVSPGLSTYGENVTGAVVHVTELLDYAASKIPKEKHKETSLFVMATAGMRLIPESQQQAVLKELREELPKYCDFIIMDQHIEIISGKWEGIYSWIAVNYALQRFDHTKIDPALEMLPMYDPETNTTYSRKPTVGMIDMGGGSVQIAFETIEKVPRMQEHMTVDLNLGYDEHDPFHHYKLYVTTFLGYGANMAITRYEKQLVDQLRKITDETKESASASSIATDALPTIKDPCLPVSLYKTVELIEEKTNSSLASAVAKALKLFGRKGVGNFDQCEKSLKDLLNLRKPCPLTCSFDGMFQPLINFTSMDFYGFSEYWYTTNDVFRTSGSWSYSAFREAAAKFCSSKWSTLKRNFDNKLYPRADVQRMRTQCIKSAWISTVLHDGFGFPRNTTKFKTVSLINNEEVQWTIGALLYRMRHFPLREMQRLGESQVQPPRYKRPSNSSVFGLVPSNALSQLLLLACIGIVVMAALKYFCVLRRYRRVAAARNGVNGFLSSPSRMPRNRSMYSYMTMDEANGSKESSTPFLQGVRVEQSGYIY